LPQSKGWSYPEGLKGDDIPIPARLMALAVMVAGFDHDNVLRLIEKSRDDEK